MGGSFFEESGWILRKKGNVYSTSDISPLYDKLYEEAEDYYGHQEGYSGALNSVSDWGYCGVMTRNQFEKAMNWYHDMHNKKRSVPKVIQDQCMERRWKNATWKRSACAVVIKDETRDTTVVSGGFIKDKGVIPAPRREKNKYVINYPGRWGNQEKRVASVPEAWKFIKNQLKKDPKFEVSSIENSYTYAKPKVGRRTRNAKQVRVEFFGWAAS